MIECGHMMARYVYGVLRPTRFPEAEAHNALWLGARTLGVEVTEVDLARRCGLGNIDPQHSGGDVWHAAIEIAIDWQPPPAGAKLVTLRKDADAVGAMAVLTARAAGETFAPDARARIELVAAADRFDHGRWPGPRAMPRSAAEVDEVGVGEQGLGAMIGGLIGADVNHGVAAMRCWLAYGEAPADWLEAARRAATVLFDRLRRGEVRARLFDALDIALVEGAAPGALRLGYRLAPIVIAIGEVEGRRKASIAQYDRAWVDLPRVAARLNEMEPGWGGSETIIGSPQGLSSRTPVEACIAAVAACRRHAAGAGGRSER